MVSLLIKMVQTSLVFLLLLLSHRLRDVAAQETACPPAVRATDGGAHCLSLIRQKAMNTSAFSTLCLPVESDVQGCVADRQFPHLPYSLSMLAFGTPCPVDPLYRLDRYLSVRYSLPTGYDIGCDHVYESPKMAEVEIDPLTDSVLAAWATRHMPKLSWRAKRNELFTLLLLNLDMHIVHLALANIRGNDIGNALVLYPYHGFTAQLVDRVVSGFFLYKQHRLLESGPEPQTFNLTSFVERNGLEGPVGINWMVTDYDAYDVQTPSFLNHRHHCPILIRMELERNSPDLPFLTPPYHLTVRFRVRFTNDAFTYKCGSLSISHNATDFYLDPLGNPIYYIAGMRNESVITMSMEMGDNEVELADKLYTLIIIDEDYPFIHGFTTNIPRGDMNSGTVIIPYNQPNPFAVHTYYFLLYEQKEEISLAATAGFTQTTCPNDRCLNGVVQAFISVNELELVGATWMRADNDDYAQCMRTM